MGDDDHRLAAALCGVSDVGWRGAGREPLVDFGVAEPQRGGEDRGSLERPQQRAGHDGIGLDALFTQLDAERARMLTARRSERAELIGHSRR